MLFKKSVMTAAVFAVGGFAAISSANAAMDTSTSSDFDVGMTVEKLCTVSTAAAISLTPGSIDIAATATQTTFNVACSQGTPYSITMSPKSGTGNSGAGVLTGLGHTEEDQRKLAYTLSENAEGTIWNGAYKTTEVGAGFGVAAKSYTVFAKLTEDSRNAKPDTYSDTVTVSVGY